MEKSVDTAYMGPLSDGSAAVNPASRQVRGSDAPSRGAASRRGANAASARRQPDLFELAEDLDLLFDAVEQDWQEQALCAQTDPEAFFPEKGGSTREAKRICNGCKVRNQCLEYALANDERFGIWGGLSERERRRLKRRMG